MEVWPYILPAITWCREHDVFVVSASPKPVYDEKKGRIGKGAAEFARAYKGKKNWDKSCLLYDPSYSLFLAWMNEEVVVDCDIHGTETVEKNFPELYEALNTSANYIVRSGSGGIHFYYKRPMNKTNWNKNTNLSRLGEYDTKGRVDIILSSSGTTGGGIYLAGSSYEYNGKQYNYTAVKGTLDEIGEMPEWLEEALDEHYTSAKKKKVKTENPVEVSDTRSVVSAQLQIQDTSLIEKLIECLPGEFFEPYQKWIRFIYCLKNLNDTITMREICVKACKKAPKYRADVEAEGKTRKVWEEVRPDGRISIGTLRYWAKSENPEAYAKIVQQTAEINILSNVVSQAEVYASTLAGTIVYDPLSNDREPRFNIYRAERGIWEESSMATLEYDYIPVMIGLCDELYKKIEDEEKKKKIKQLKGSIANGYNVNRLKMLKTCLDPTKHKGFVDENFVLNGRPELLPLKNGVFNFETGVLEPLDRTHYVSYRLPIAYNPDADTSDIEKAMMDWFKGDKEKIEFLQYWLGYCLTGYTDRQDFLIMYGKNGGNGKSLLFEEILGKDIFGKHLFQTLAGDALTREGANNDSIYSSKGKRMILLSEGEKAKGAEGINVNLLKKWTGGGDINISAKNKSNIDFSPEAKPVCLTNEIVKIPHDAKAYYRRTMYVEQNVSFVNPAIYEKLSEEEKASGDFKPQDLKFVLRLRANTEGTLKWLMTGTMMYMKDRKRRPPSSILKFTDEIRCEADPEAKWMKSSLMKTTDESVLKAKEIVAKYCIDKGIQRIDLHARSRLMEKMEEVMNVEKRGDPKNGYKYVGLKFSETIDE